MGVNSNFFVWQPPNHKYVYSDISMITLMFAAGAAIQSVPSSFLVLHSVLSFFLTPGHEHTHNSFLQANYGFFCIAENTA